MLAPIMLLLHLHDAFAPLLKALLVSHFEQCLFVRLVGVNDLAVLVAHGLLVLVVLGHLRSASIFQP